MPTKSQERSHFAAETERICLNRQQIDGFYLEIERTSSSWRKVGILEIGWGELGDSELKDCNFMGRKASPIDPIQGLVVTREAREAMGGDKPHPFLRAVRSEKLGF